WPKNINDADVKDRAKNLLQYAFTSLSKIAIQSIFQLHASDKDATSALSSFVTGNDAYQFTSTIQKLQKPVLELMRYEQNKETFVPKENVVVSSILDILQKYNEYLASHEPVVKLPFILKHIGNVEEIFADLYSIVITSHSYPSTKEISVVKIPIFRKLENKEKIIVLSIIPVEPYPLTLYFEAEFTCKNGCSYICDLPPLDIEFKDLFMPLPVPESFHTTTNSWRKELFEALWKHFAEEACCCETSSNCCQSSFCLKIKKENFSADVEQKWGPFIVSKSKDLIYDIAVYLPPQNHLLMKISTVNDRVFAHIIVDKSEILPWFSRQKLSQKLESFIESFPITDENYPLAIESLTKRYGRKERYYEEFPKKLQDSFYIDNCVTSVQNNAELEIFVESATNVMREGMLDRRGCESSAPPLHLQKVQDQKY
ncbi:AP-5 complex subunit beta-1, partial [Caerostris extrusa]